MGGGEEGEFKWHDFNSAMRRVLLLEQNRTIWDCHVLLHVQEVKKSDCVSTAFLNASLPKGNRPRLL